MGAVRFRWRGKEFERRLRFAMQQKVRAISRFLTQRIRYNISRHFTQIEGPSKPGEYPHYDTGNLYRSTSWHFHHGKGPNVIAAKVVNTARYARKLEFPMRRSFVRRTVRENLGTLRAIARQKVRL